ncbi:unnamed protein product [marine sediment metagenome]|uniref:DNA-directed RNA polymerase II subunit RPB9-like zinc ribbon domain-containing protein n=1 Tax=marine sediment metagenome TaxID=412755 RepID=X0TYD1_9ZZZZ
MTIEEYTRHLRNSKLKKGKNEKLVIIETMKFCPDCDNIIFPKNKKLYCKACDKEFDVEAEAEDFKIVKKIIHDEKESAPIVVKEAMGTTKISAQDRKAFEEFFDAGGAESY